jgi:hypothetical protein
MNQIFAKVLERLASAAQQDIVAVICRIALAGMAMPVRILVKHWPNADAQTAHKSTLRPHSKPPASLTPIAHRIR